MAYELIETIEVGSGGAASIEFTSIPQDGVDLLLLLSARSTDGDNRADITVDSGTSNTINLFGVGNAAYSGTASVAEITSGDSDYTANTFGNAQLYISNYTSSSNKSASLDGVNENNATSAIARIDAATFTMSEAITSLTMTMAFAQYSTASLYKIY